MPKQKSRKTHTRYRRWDPHEQEVEEVEDEDRDDGGEGSAPEDEEEFSESVYHTADGSTGSPPTETSFTTAPEEDSQIPAAGPRAPEQSPESYSPVQKIGIATTPQAYLAPTNNNSDEAGNQAQAPQLRGMAMNQYGAQPSSRQTPRLQNTQKSGLGNGNAGAGWAFGAPASGNAFGALAGGAPGLGQVRPQQLSGFAQVMGGGSGQAPIDMRYVLS